MTPGHLSENDNNEQKFVVFFSAARGNYNGFIIFISIVLRGDLRSCESLWNGPRMR